MIIINSDIIFVYIFLILLFSLLPIFSTVPNFVEMFSENNISIGRKILLWINMISCIFLLCFISIIGYYCNKCEEYYHDAEVIYYSGSTNAPNEYIQKNLDILIIENIKKTNK